MIERQEYRCAGTGVELQPEWASLDHKMPRSMGGSNDIDNLHIVHETINASKGDMDWVDFVAMERKFKIRASDLAQGIALEHLAFLAFESCKQQNIT